MTKTIIRNITVYGEQEIIRDGYVEVASGKITDIGMMQDLKIDRDTMVIEGEGNSLIPGMIDIHIHAAVGADAMDSTPESMNQFAKSLVKEGTTSFLPTTMTQHPDTICTALKNISTYRKEQGDAEAEILGIHLEGPFVNADNAGAQPKNYIIDPDIALFKKFQDAANQMIKVVTIAPERPNGVEMVQYLTETNVIASVGHSGASAEETEAAFAAGAAHVTHMYNGLTPFHHRAAGVIGAVLMNKDKFVEMIVDGYHVSPYVVNLTYQIKGAEHIFLITDSMRAKGLPDGDYELGGQPVIVKNGEARIESGALAGSTAKMSDIMKNMMKFTGCSLVDIIQMTSTNQAKQLGVFDRLGSISVGKDADFVLLNDEHDLVMTIKRGTIAYQA